MYLLLNENKLDQIDCRMGEGFWRRGGETPSAVKWEDRIIEIREGSWSYVAGSIGTSPGMLYYIHIYNFSHLWDKGAKL